MLMQSMGALEEVVVIHDVGQSFKHQPRTLYKGQGLNPNKPHNIWSYKWHLKHMDNDWNKKTLNYSLSGCYLEDGAPVRVENTWMVCQCCITPLEMYINPPEL